MSCTKFITLIFSLVLMGSCSSDDADKKHQTQPSNKVAITPPQKIVKVKSSEEYVNWNDKNVYRIDTERILHNENLGDFLSKLKSERFKILRSKKDIPAFIKLQLPCFNDHAIADPDSAYNATDVFNDALPWRSLIFLCKSKDVLVVVFEHGGVGAIDKIMLIEFANNIVTDLWCSSSDCGRLQSIQDIVKYVGQCRKKRDPHQSNMVYF